MCADKQHIDDYFYVKCDGCYFYDISLKNALMQNHVQRLIAHLVSHGHIFCVILRLVTVSTFSVILCCRIHREADRRICIRDEE